MNVRDVNLGNNQVVMGRLRVHIAEGADEFVFIDDLRRYFLIQDLTKDAVWISFHLAPPEGVSEKLLKKQLWAPVWQAGPV